jgi:2-oxoisovalerate dehydrogenase E1 component
MSTQEILINDFVKIAQSSKVISAKFLSDNKSLINQAVLIREVESSFLRLFSEGRLRGTIHTCVGQEFTGVSVGKFLKESDWVTSNHRCHGHFIAKTGNWRGLIDELIGKSEGISHGIGSSQHLFEPGFMSNGPQGSLLPVAAGLALSAIKKKTNDLVLSFIGEGTLGEGIVYETLNLSSVMKLPHIILCENNLYSQSTPQSSSMVGSITDRAKAFGWTCIEANTWDVEDLFTRVNHAIEGVRQGQGPCFINIATYRLNAHSKGDDNRPSDEIATFKELDPLNRIIEEHKLHDLQAQVSKEVNEYADHQVSKEIKFFSFSKYKKDQLPRNVSQKNRIINNPETTMIKSLNTAYRNQVSSGAIMVGEDIADPYGGTFKVTKGIQNDFPENVISTPISEAAITGLSIGLSVSGISTYVEIMFGDFITNSTDQIINNACKFYHMYGHKISAPVKIRAAMGGYRGYGPTHSQSLEKMFLGAENLSVFAPTSLINPGPLIDNVEKLLGPAMIVENKVDYTSKLWTGSPGLETSITGGNFGTIAVKPIGARAEVTVITYGATGRWIADNYESLFRQVDVVFEIFTFQLIHPIPISHVERSVRKTKAVLVVEEGIEDFGWASEVIFKLNSRVEGLIADRVGSLPVPIPSVKILEDKVLPSIDRVSKKLKKIFESRYG